MLTSTGSSSYIAFSMRRIDSSWPSAAQETDFLFLVTLVGPVAAGGVSEAGGGVETTGEPLRAFAINLRASWKGSREEGCATLTSGSGFTGTIGAFLKLGSFGLGFGAEKNDESDLASFTAVTTGFVSFFATGREDEELTAIFLIGGGGLVGGSLSFRFLPFESLNRSISGQISAKRIDVTHPLSNSGRSSLSLHLDWRPSAAIYVRHWMPYP
jgi:hypothetical protein